MQLGALALTPPHAMHDEASYLEDHEIYIASDLFVHCIWEPCITNYHLYSGWISGTLHDSRGDHQKWIGNFLRSKFSNLCSLWSHTRLSDPLSNHLAGDYVLPVTTPNPGLDRNPSACGVAEGYPAAQHVALDRGKWSTGHSYSHQRVMKIGFCS